MKKIDLLIIRSFIPPLIVWFLVAVFIFNMQFLWKYIDDIVGKGLELRVIAELLFYQALAMVPRSLAFGVVIASVMTLGNLAEHYELASMKSAGISLLRVMQPLIIVTTGLAVASFIFSNNIIPVTALQFKTRLYDIRRAKPALDLEPGQFNNDFKNMVIYIGAKDKQSRKLENVRIYDHNQRNPGGGNQTNAKKGELYFSDDKRYLVIKLDDGRRFEQVNPGFKTTSNYYPYMRMRFDEFQTLFDMAEFNFSETDKNLFKNHYSLLTLQQLWNSMDSLLIRREQRVDDIQKNTSNFYYYQRTGVAEVTDSSTRPLRQYSPFEEAPEVELLEVPKNYQDVLPIGDLVSIYKRAQSFARNVKTQASNVERSLPHYTEELAAHENEVHIKFVFAIACLVFLFIGAPMGAIIRKGGFGWPIFISFFFFMAFFVLHLAGERLAKNLIWPCWMGSWMPVWALLPIAVFLSYRAMNDSSSFNFSAIRGFFVRIFQPKKWKDKS